MLSTIVDIVAVERNCSSETPAEDPTFARIFSGGLTAGTCVESLCLVPSSIASETAERMAAGSSIPELRVATSASCTFGRFDDEGNGSRAQLGHCIAKGLVLLHSFSEKNQANARRRMTHFSNRSVPAQRLPGHQFLAYPILGEFIPVIPARLFNRTPEGVYRQCWARPSEPLLVRIQSEQRVRGGRDVQPDVARVSNVRWWIRKGAEFDMKRTAKRFCWRSKRKGKASNSPTSPIPGPRGVDTDVYSPQTTLAEKYTESRNSLQSNGNISATYFEPVEVERALQHHEKGAAEGEKVMLAVPGAPGQEPALTTWDADYAKPRNTNAMRAQGPTIAHLEAETRR
ncbi:hypothetical protein B0H14DRAFT_3744700 [Mycena olivaceomarginata]|nr:hypothetical protein B0H14DRAFT_3744700 [Mycena olivaceomarginata]